MVENKVRYENIYEEVSQVDYDDNDLGTKVDLVFGRYHHEMQKKLFPELQALGLGPNEAKILVYLLIRNNCTAPEIAKFTGIGRTETYHYLYDLMAKGVVVSTFDRPHKYHALPFKEIVDSLVQVKQDALRVVSERKDDYEKMLTDIAKGLVIPTPGDTSNFQVIKGDIIKMKVKKMLLKTRKEAMLLLSSSNLGSFYHAEITDLLATLSEKGLDVVVKTSCKNPDDYFPSQIECNPKSIWRSVSSGAMSDGDLTLSFIIVDLTEMIIIFENGQKNRTLCAMYIDNPAIITFFRYVFETLT